MTGEVPSLNLSLAEFTRIFRRLSRPQRIPLTLTIPEPAASPAALYRTLRNGTGFLLESMEGVPRRAVRSIIGTGIQETIVSGEGEGESSSPVAYLRSVTEKEQLISTAPSGFAGGLVGYCSYDMVSSLNHGYLDAGLEEGRPLARFMRATSGIVINHQDATCTLFTTPLVSPGTDAEPVYADAVRDLHTRAALVRRIPTDAPVDLPSEPGENTGRIISPMSREQFTAGVEEILGHIRAGNIFQAVVSRKFESPYPGDPFRIYTAVREINPSPYLYFLEFGDETIIGSSPEMLVKAEGRTVSTVPIAGTRPRGASPEEDARLAEEMRRDTKEQAEHLMLVDLARNDIGRVASFGSVQVPSFMEVEQFSHVQHLTSVVTGTLRDGCDRFDALEACFPAGTVSGAPKLRAMQIIAGLEPHPRGLYAGAVGYIGFDDRLEFAIAIRTAIVRDGIVSFQTGAGIVADSDPVREYEETVQKAGAMMSAISRAMAAEETVPERPGGIA